MSRSLARARRICQPPENSSAGRLASSREKPRPSEHLAGLRFERVAIVMLELSLDPVVAVGNLLVFLALRVGLRHLMRERFHFLFDFEQVAEDGEALFHDGASRERHPILRKVPRGRALGREERSIVESLDARQHLEQRRLAGPVPTDQADTISVVHDPVEALEECLGAEMFSCRRKLDHEYEIAARSRKCEDLAQAFLFHYISPGKRSYESRFRLLLAERMGNRSGQGKRKDFNTEFTESTEKTWA